MTFVCIHQMLLIFACTLDWLACNVIYNNILNGISFGTFALDDVENILLIDGVILKDMPPYIFSLLFKSSHLFFIAQHAHHVITSHYA